MEGFDLLRFLGMGLLYCLFLVLIVVGIMLAIRSRIAWYWVVSGAIPWLCDTGFWLWFRLAPETVLRLQFVLRVLLGVTAVWLAAGGGGWLSYLRRRRVANRA